MSYGFNVRVQGDYACFTRPEMKVERVSYDVITPSAARGILEAVYWKPAIRWVIDRIHVLNEIQYTNIRRNEVSSKVSNHLVNQEMKKDRGQFYLNVLEARQQRAALVLKNVDYILEAHFEMNPEKAGPEDTVEKHYNIALRRFRKGQHYHAPALGTREFAARVELLEGSLPASVYQGVKELGWMLFDLDFSNPQDIRPVFFNASMRDGIIQVSGTRKAG